MNIALIFAGGTGTRMQLAGAPKQFLEVNGKPVIIHTLEHFEHHAEIDGIVIACVATHIPYLRNLLKEFHIEKVKSVVAGGKTSQESIYLGLCEASELYPQDSLVLIHDAVRPIITAELITQNIKTAKKHGNAISSCFATETVSLSHNDHTIHSIMPRSKSLILKAPQTFILKDILAVQQAARESGEHAVDCATLMISKGHTLFYIPSHQTNIKLTMQADYHILKILLNMAAPQEPKKNLEG